MTRVGEPLSRHIVRVANLSDPQGRNPKDRCCVVVDRTACGKIVLLVAVTGEFDQAKLEADEVRLASGNPQQPSAMGFTKPTVAKCSWLAIVSADDCEYVAGPMSETQFNAILETVSRLRKSGSVTLVRDDRCERY